MNSTQNYVTFDGHRIIAHGSLATVALAVKHALESHASGPVLTFDSATGRTVQFDTRGSDEDVLARLEPPAVEASIVSANEDQPAEESRGRGRPKLGVVAREVTLLPRHWDWLATQPGGASVALRKLVETASRANLAKDQRRKAQEVAYRFMSAMAGNLPDFEEASRTLFADDQLRFRKLIAVWPDDVCAYATQLAFGELDEKDSHS